MAYDVSIYYLRTETGYLSTVGGGSAISSGSSPIASATSSGGGGSSSGTVKTTGVQRASGEKYWDSNASFTYDVSIGGDLFLSGINEVSTGQILFYNPTSGLITYADASLGGGGLSDVSLGGLTDVIILNPADRDIVAYDGTDWNNEITVDITDVFQNKIPNSSPAASDSGTAGDWAYDSSYFYICTATDTWKRISLTGGY